MPDPSGLYPQPVPPGNAFAPLLSNPIGAATGLLQIQQMQGQRAAGNALMQGLNPDGTFNPNAALTAARNGPPLGMAGSQFSGDFLARRNVDIANKTAALALGIGNNEAVATILAPYANEPISSEQSFRLKAQLAAAGIDPGTVAAADLNGAVKMANAAKLAAVQKMGAGTANQPIPGTPSPSGVDTAQPLATTVGVGARPVGNPPGLVPAATAIGAASGQQSVNLTQAADTSPVRKGMLGNLEGDLKQFSAGQGADWQNIAKNWANRNVLPTSLQFDPKSIASQEEFNKQAEQLAQQQFSAIGGTGTDAKFGSAFKANPNETLSQMGNVGIIRLLKGNEDAIQAKNNAWQASLAAGASPASYPQFAAKFNQTFDPRVYQAQYLGKDDLKKMFSGMSPAEQHALADKIAAAKSAGYVTGPGSQYNGQ